MAEINNSRVSFVKEEDAMLYLFDNNIQTFRKLTKEIYEYVYTKDLLVYEFWHIDNRIGYVTYGFERYVDDNDVVRQRKAYVWRFVGFGRTCCAKDKETLREKVLKTLERHSNAPDELGYKKYPYYTKHYREQLV